ncbi:MAG: phospho-N-acetylmuramoyl-pentapeptide-transferase, partial [Anaeroplasmataceae bacterium]|nr:phospho-N-acetylmuramoyl-pentapeptide-transferase [Anaeroplasmataceae bacterium]
MNGLEVIKLLVLSLLSVFLYSIYVKGFKKLSQTERTLGLDSHKKKNGTITMGGIIFLVLPLFFIPFSKTTMMILFAALGFGILGAIDDLLIVILKKNDGLPAWFKILVEIAIASIIFFFYLKENNSTTLELFSFKLDIKWFFGLIILWLMLASSNAWNLMDGVDGLCAGCSLVFGIGLMLIAFKEQKYDIFYMLIAFHITLFVFWCFNLPKAFLFMGDVGALGLGAFYAITSIYLNSLVAFILMAGLFIFETLSVILQVFYFKKTKGKRLFKMAPFHHHLEACGLKELQIDLIFYIIQIVLVILAICLL